MLSIIICSVDKAALERVKKNIADTAGVIYEIIAIDNSSNQYSICKAYNIGGRKAQYPFLCFMHEDIQFITHNWGCIICERLSDQKTGLLGLAGGDSISMVPSSWSVPIISNEINIIQHYKRTDKPTKHIVKTNPSVPGSFKRVAALDGVFLCTRKTVFEEFQFDEQLLTGFHGYDLDYSLQLNEKYNLYVIFDITVQHFSEGNPDRKWMENIFKVASKWKHRLPVSIHSSSKDLFNLHHWNALQVLLKHLIRLQYNKLFILKIFFNYSFTRFFHFRRFLSTGKLLIFESFK